MVVINNIVVFSTEVNVVKSWLEFWVMEFIVGSKMYRFVIGWYWVTCNDV